MLLVCAPVKNVPCAVLLMAAALLHACGEHPPERGPSRPGALRSSAEPVRITMDMLHQAGGVPPGWRFTLPDGDVAAGRKAFVDSGCHSCHAVRGESFTTAGDASHVGPELTGMGSHHPAMYFVESILNPDAVLVEGPGYFGADGHSRMPTYPDMTLAELADLVAYLRSLTDASGQEAMGTPTPVVGPRPAPPPSQATMFFVQLYDVKEGQLEAFQDWFAHEGGPALRTVDGLVSVDTYVDNTRASSPLVTIIGFRDDAALGRFLQDPAGAQLKQKFDEFIGPHGHQMFRIPPVYRVAGLSAP